MKKIALTIMALVAGLSMNSQAYDQNNCTFNECLEVRDAVMRRLTKLAAKEIQLSDYARDEKGQILYMTVYAADTYCKNRGLRLPTASELDTYLMSFGAFGRKSKLDMSREVYGGDYYYSRRHDPDAGFKWPYKSIPCDRPSCTYSFENRATSIWSSTLEEEETNSSYARYSILYLGSTIIYGSILDNWIAVRCVQAALGAK